MDFAAAMRFVEDDHAFPRDPAAIHERRLARLLARSGLDARLRGLPLVVVGGSCGKASTARMLAFILRAAGMPRVGLGTKPPLRETADGHRERYQVLDAEGAKWISPTMFVHIVEELRTHVEANPEDYAPYDLRMWILLRMFVEMRVSVGIVEANIGLRRDPTAAIETPAAMVLTRVATDHASMLRAPDPLSPALRAVGEAAGPVWHKAGGLRPGIPTVIGCQDAGIMRAILEIAPPPTRLYGRDFVVEEAHCGMDGSDVRLRVDAERIHARLSTLGTFQVENAATAAAAASMLCDRGLVPPLVPISQAIAEGLAVVDTPGRMQCIDRAPLTLFNLAAGVAKLEAMMSSTLALTGDRPLVAALSVIERSADPRACVHEVVRHPQVCAFIACAVLDGGDTRDIAAETLAGWAREIRPHLRIEAVAPHQVVEAARCACPPHGAVLLAGDGLGAHLDLHAREVAP